MYQAVLAKLCFVPCIVSTDMQLLKARDNLTYIATKNNCHSTLQQMNVILAMSASIYKLSKH